MNRGLSMKVLELLVKNGPLSYAEIAAKLEVTAKNVSDTAGELQAKNWIHKQVEQEGSVRRVVISATSQGRARVQNGILPGGNLPADNAAACAAKEAKNSDSERIKQLEAKVKELNVYIAKNFTSPHQPEPIGYVIVPAEKGFFRSIADAKNNVENFPRDVYLAAIIGQTKTVWE